MIILVTGHRGFVGSHLVRRLQSEDHTVVTIDRDNPYHDGPIDLIVNCAAELTDESKMFNSNVELVIGLLSIVRARPNIRMIQIGSSSEYGRINTIRKEDTVCIPSNVYEATKLAATALCQGYASRYDLDICIARPFSLYGPNDKPRKLIPTLYRSLIDHRQIDVYPAEHDWLYIDDFIDGLLSLINAPRETTKGQIFNFGTGVSSSNRQVVEAIELAVGGKLNVVFKTDGRYHNHDVDNWVADASKARTVLGWQPRYDLAVGIQAFVMTEWFKGDKG
jgi:UDP-glucuronate 4-epimerase